jgi:hypothetical protein
MSFSQDAGYTPVSIDTMMLSVMDNINTQFGTTYTAETFIGTNFYKYFYALMQRVQENEVKTSEIFLKLQQYIAITNEKIARPVVTAPGLIEIIDKSGYISSVKDPIDADAGKVFICVDKKVASGNWEDDPGYDANKLAVCTIIKDSVVAGVVTQGTEVETITLSNGQDFDFKYNLPTRTEVHLRLTLTLSDNNQVAIGDPDDVKLLLLQHIHARYSLGKDFEPQRYFTTSDAPWAAEVLLEWSDDNEVNYYSTVFSAAYNDIFSIALERIHLVEA